MTSKNTGEADLYAQIIPKYPEATLDLHGFYRDEALFEAENFLEKAQEKKWIKVRIITGRGEILRPAVFDFLKQKKDIFSIFEVEEYEGYFDILLHL